MSKAKKIYEYIYGHLDELDKPHHELATYYQVHPTTIGKVKKKIREEINFNPNITNNESITDNNDCCYENLGELSKDEKSSLESYCITHNIPFDHVKTAKFINHMGQEAWNIVCDPNRVTKKDIIIQFDKLKKHLSEGIEPVVLPKSTKLDKKAAYHFYFSDKHVGAKTAKNSLYENDYNAGVFEQRMLASLEDYIEEAESFGKFDKVLIGDFGDCLDGWNGKTTRKSNHTLPQNMDNKEAFDTYIAVMIRFMETLIGLGLSNSYEMVSVTNDNHSGDFGYIVNRALEIYLNVKYPEIKTRILEKFIEVYEYGIHTFMFTHGKDSEDMRYGLPYNLDAKATTYINDFIMCNDLPKNNVHFIKGDLHQENTTYSKLFRYRNVLSLYGASKWIMTNFGYNQAGISSEIVYKDKDKIVPLVKRF